MESLSYIIDKSIDQGNNKKDSKSLKTEFEDKFKHFCRLQGKSDTKEYQRLKHELLDIQDKRKNLVMG